MRLKLDKILICLLLTFILVFNTYGAFRTDEFGGSGSGSSSTPVSSPSIGVPHDQYQSEYLPKPDSITNLIAYSIVRLNVRFSQGIEDDGKRIGTGFIVGSPSLIPEGSIYFIVTSTKVLKNTTGFSFNLYEKDPLENIKISSPFTFEESNLEEIVHHHPNAEISIINLSKAISSKSLDIKSFFFRSISFDDVYPKQKAVELSVVENFLTGGYIGDYPGYTFPFFKKGITVSHPGLGSISPDEFLIDLGKFFDGYRGAPVLLFNNGIYFKKGGLKVGKIRLKIIGMINDPLIVDSEDTPFGRVLMGGLIKDFIEETRNQLPKINVIQDLEEKARNGDVEAQVNLGKMYIIGVGVEKDEVKAREIFETAIKQENASAQANLGIMYEQGLGGLEKNESHAVELYREAANKGDAEGLKCLGVMYLTGRGIEKNEKEASRLLTLSAEKGNEEAKSILAKYKFHKVTKITITKTLVEKAGKGDVEAQVKLGMMYLSGFGVEKDEVKAREFFEAAAEQKNALAQVNLGIMYENGIGGLEKNESYAVELYREAANQGDANGQKCLGVMYLGGRGVEKDEDEAIRLLTLSAEKDNEEAKIILAMINMKQKAI